MEGTIYEDADTGKIFTFDSMKESLEKEFGKTISDKEMDIFIFRNLQQNGGNIVIQKAGEL